jgi:hypothetical protein
VYSVSVVYQPVNDDHEVPFALAIADLDDGWTMLTHIVGCAPEAVRIGMRIRFDPDASRSRMLPLFQPASRRGVSGRPGSGSRRDVPVTADTTEVRTPIVQAVVVLTAEENRVAALTEGAAEGLKRGPVRPAVSLPV